MSKTAQVTMATVWYDDQSDPSNPGWCLSYMLDDGQDYPAVEALATTGITDESGAIAESALWLGVDVDAMCDLLGAWNRHGMQS